MAVRLNEHQQKELHNIDDDLSAIKKDGNTIHTKAKVGKDMEKLQNLLDDLPSDASNEVKSALQNSLFALKDAVKGDGKDVDMDKVGEAESGLKQAMGESEEEE